MILGAVSCMYAKQKSLNMLLVAKVFHGNSILNNGVVLYG